MATSTYPHLFVDDNSHYISASEGMRPKFGSAGTISCTLTGTTQELALPSPTQTARKVSMVLVTAGAQGAFFAMGAAGASASYTGITNMLMLPANTSRAVRLDPADVKVYALQLGTAGTFQVIVLE